VHIYRSPRRWHYTGLCGQVGGCDRRAPNAAQVNLKRNPTPGFKRCGLAVRRRIIQHHAMETTPPNPPEEPTTSAAPTPEPVRCYCGLSVAYEECCGRWHSGPERLMAPDAEKLMRSRYSAVVLGLGDYLMDTWDPSTRPATMDLNEPRVRWLRLEVRRVDQIDETRATVEFVAFSQQRGRRMRLHEISRFERKDGKWLYLDPLSIKFN
jgi:SEC-C motif-containing protein